MLTVVLYELQLPSRAKNRFFREASVFSGYISQLHICAPLVPALGDLGTCRSYLPVCLHFCQYCIRSSNDRGTRVMVVQEMAGESQSLPEGKLKNVLDLEDEDYLDAVSATNGMVTRIKATIEVRYRRKHSRCINPFAGGCTLEPHHFRQA